MRFEIDFYSVTRGAPLQVESEDIGLEGVEFIRTYLELPNLSLSVIRPDCQRRLSHPEVEISEELAKESGLFQNRNKVDIAVKGRSLNRFLYPEVDYSQKDDGAITRAQIYYKLNESELVSAWKEAGFPTKWMIEEERSEHGV